MATFDTNRGEIVFRIVYDGLATAGKSTNLAMLHALERERSRAERTALPELTGGRTLFFDWLELSSGYVDDLPVCVQVLSVPGQIVFAQRRIRVLRDADAVVLVCDSSEQGAGLLRLSWELHQLLKRHAGCADVPAVIQANKQDAPNALSAAQIRARIGASIDDVEIVEASARSGESVRTTFITALRAARERLRDRLSAAPVTSLTGERPTIARLLEQIVDDERCADTTRIDDEIHQLVEATQSPG